MVSIDRSANSDNAERTKRWNDYGRRLVGSVNNHSISFFMLLVLVFSANSAAAGDGVSFDLQGVDEFLAVDGQDDSVGSGSKRSGKPLLSWDARTAGSLTFPARFTRPRSA